MFILVFGILGLVFCFIFGIIAWVQGNTYIRNCRALQVQPDGLAVAGRVLGILSTVLVVITFALAFLAGFPRIFG